MLGKHLLVQIWLRRFLRLIKKCYSLTLTLEKDTYIKCLAEVRPMVYLTSCQDRKR